MQPKSLAARAGRWSARHRKAAIIGWLAFVIAAIAIGGAVGTKYIDQDNNGVGESGHAQQVLRQNFVLRADEQVLVQNRSESASDPAFRATVTDVVHRLSALPSVVHMRSPLAPGNRGAISRDGHSALVQFEIRGRSSDAEQKVGASLAATAAAQKAHPAF